MPFTEMLGDMHGSYGRATIDEGNGRGRDETGHKAPHGFSYMAFENKKGRDSTTSVRTLPLFPCGYSELSSRPIELIGFYC
jgi:hypothetical protein